jgi:predicted transcriptional regulator
MDEELRFMENAAKGSMQKSERLFELLIRNFPQIHLRQRNERTPKQQKYTPTMPTNFVFSGKKTDICYFAYSEKMPLSVLANIADPKLKKKVLAVFDKYEKDKYVSLNGDYIELTDKGKKLLCKVDFTKQAAEDQQKAFSERIVSMYKSDNDTISYVELSGHHENDFTYFYSSDTLDLKSVLLNPDKELSDKVIDNIKDWQEKGFVEVIDNKAIITDDGKKLLEEEEFKTATVALEKKTVPVSELKATPKKLIMPTDSATFEAASQSIKQAIKQSAKAAQKMVKKL